MDILYYSNQCKHCKKILQVLSKTQIKEKVSFICIDNRAIDKQTNQTFILLNNGSKVIMPPNLASVPALLNVKENYRMIFGDKIIDYLHPQIITGESKEVIQNGEPNSYSFNGVKDNITSESFTFYDLTPDELSAKGTGGRRQLYNYVPVGDGNMTIHTPPDNYNPNKIAGDVTIDVLEKQRNQDLGNTQIPDVPNFTY